MCKYGLRCPVRKANPYRRMAKALKTDTTADNLLNRQFKEHGLRKVLLTDITYIPLSVILDAFTKQVLAYVLSESLELDFVLETVNLRIERHGVSLDAETLIHCDQGCHYTSKKFRQIVCESNWRQSVSRRENCWDNAPQERFFGHMKDETGSAYLSTLDMRAQKLNGYLVSDKAYDMIYKSIKESMLVVSIDVERMNFIDDLDIINVDDMEWKPYIKEIAGKVAG